jgi:hypothetical protein
MSVFVSPCSGLNPKQCSFLVNIINCGASISFKSHLHSNPEVLWPHYLSCFPSSLQQDIWPLRCQIETALASGLVTCSLTASGGKTPSGFFSGSKVGFLTHKPKIGSAGASVCVLSTCSLPRTHHLGHALGLLLQGPGEEKELTSLPPTLSHCAVFGWGNY